ncbi:hypothetical protein AZE42_01156 [Rhizopogon vesiculosus]|uniref:Uncharacterized protein n=1 Tax=Rhizopogon vesiculosus TaxID=180088 RepID=A0A1J8PM09_9AGAM|nr:hypothetical protein AZE42_01156 [Rhizopogon vesiculosus]
MSPRKSFAPQTPVDRSGSSASSGWGSWRKPRPILEDLRNTLSTQAMKDGRHNIKQDIPFTSSPFHAIDSVASPERRSRHRRANAEYLVNPITLPLNPISELAPSPSHNNMLASAHVDMLVFRGSKYDTSPEEDNIFSIKRSLSMVFNHNVDNVSSPLSPSPGSSHAAILYHHNQVIKPRRVPLNRRGAIHRNAPTFTVPQRSHTSPLSSPTSPNSSLSDLVSKRSGRTFKLVSSQKDRSVPAAAAGGRIESSLDSPCSSSSPQHGLPPDMLAILQELDELASWIREFTDPEKASGELDSDTCTAPASCLYAHGDDPDDDFLQRPALRRDKGKGRLLTEPVDDMDSGLSEWKPLCTTTSRSAISSTSTPVVRRRQSACYIYDPLRSPSFLVGSSTSPIAYPAEGYRSPPPSPTTGTPRRSGWHSVPNTSPVSPLFGITFFKTFFKRSRSDTMSVPQTNTSGRNKILSG